MSRNAQVAKRCGWALPAIALAAVVLAQPDSAAPPRLSAGKPAPAARVVVAREAGAVDAFVPNPAKVRSLVNRGVTALTGKAGAREAWRSLVTPQDKVGIKVYTSPGPSGGTRREVVSAVVEGLLDAGVPRQNIIVWDRFRHDLRLAGYFELEERHGIRVAASAETGYDDAHFYESSLIGNLVWGDHEFGRKGEDIGRKSYVSKLVTQQMTKLINITPLLNHNQAGVTGHLYSLALGSVDNSIRFESSRVHLNVAVPEIYALPVLGDRVALNITDALICQYQGEQRSLLHYSATLNELRFSTDPVALDVLSIQELDRQRERAEIPGQKTDLELYTNASLVEIGVSNAQRINVEMAGEGTRAEGSSRR